MASETARQTSLIQEDPPADECCENVPPKVCEAAKLEVQTENDMSSPVRLCDGNRPGSNVSTLSTPTVSEGLGGKAMSPLSGLHSAVSPVLKHLNISNKCSTPFKHGNSLHLSCPFDTMVVSTAHRESKGDFSRQMCAKDTSVSLIQEEYLPEISSLELTYLQQTANDSVLPPQDSTKTSSDETHQVEASVGESGGSPEVPQLAVTTASADLRSKGAPVLAGILETEITLLDVSYNNDLSPVGQISSLDIIPEIPSCHYLNDSNTLPELSRHVASEPSSSNVFLNELVTKTSLVVNQSHFDKSSLQKSSGGSTLEAAAVRFENLTFDCEASSQRNGTITLSEISSTDGDQVLDKPSSPKFCRLTFSLKHDDSEEKTTELPKHETTLPPGMEDKPGDTFEVTPALEDVSGDGEETKHQSQSGLPVRDGSSDMPCWDTVSSKATNFNLDETLDLGTDLLITSTPMTNCKSFNFGSSREADSASAAHEKFSKAGPSKPADMVVSDIPPNIVGDHKTFLKQPAVGSHRPPLKVAPQSSMSRWGSTVPGQLEKASAVLPLKQSRVQAAAGKPSAATEEPRGTAGTSGSYNLRSLTAASRKPPSDLQRPPPSTIPRLTTGLRLPTARTYMPSSSGPAVPNPVAKQPQGKKHPFPKGEALPVSKKKKTDTATSSMNAEASAPPGPSTSKEKTLKRPAVGQTSASTQVQRNDAEVPTAGTSVPSTSCDRPNRLRALKPPGANQRAPLVNPQSLCCAKCKILQEELSRKSEEVQRLKEELLKYRKPDDS